LNSRLRALIYANMRKLFTPAVFFVLAVSLSGCYWHHGYYGHPGYATAPPIGYHQGGNGYGGGGGYNHGN
jgi:hypothetical protein